MAYVDTNQPLYQLLLQMSEEDKHRVKELIETKLQDFSPRDVFSMGVDLLYEMLTEGWEE